jgi:hypothetical protein
MVVDCEFLEIVPYAGHSVNLDMSISHYILSST